MNQTQSTPQTYEEFKKQTTVAQLLKDFPIEKLLKPKSEGASQELQMKQARQDIDDAKNQEQKLTQDAKAQAKAALLGL